MESRISQLLVDVSADSDQRQITVVVLDTYLCNKGRVQSVLGNTVQIEMRHAHLDIAAASSAEFAKKRTSALAQR